MCSDLYNNCCISCGLNLVRTFAVVQMVSAEAYENDNKVKCNERKCEHCNSQARAFPLILQEAEDICSNAVGK